MKFIKIISLLLIVFAFSSCVSNSTNKTTDESKTAKITDKAIVGTWVNDSYKDGKAIYKKYSDFKSDQPGIQLNKDGTMIKRQNAGWCGTPPISYSNFNGTWKKINKTTMTIRYEYWGGTAEEDLEIAELTKNTLAVKTIAYRNERIENNR